jgi:hypothetical protein
LVLKNAGGSFVPFEDDKETGGFPNGVDGFLANGLAGTFPNDDEDGFLANGLAGTFPNGDEDALGNGEAELLTDGKGEAGFGKGEVLVLAATGVSFDLPIGEDGVLGYKEVRAVASLGGSDAPNGGDEILGDVVDLTFAALVVVDIRSVSISVLDDFPSGDDPNGEDPNGGGFTGGGVCCCEPNGTTLDLLGGLTSLAGLAKNGFESDVALLLRGLEREGYPRVLLLIPVALPKPLMPPLPNGLVGKGPFGFAGT